MLSVVGSSHKRDNTSCAPQIIVLSLGVLFVHFIYVFKGPRSTGYIFIEGICNQTKTFFNIILDCYTYHKHWAARFSKPKRHFRKKAYVQELTVKVVVRPLTVHICEANMYCKGASPFIKARRQTCAGVNHLFPRLTSKK